MTIRRLHRLWIASIIALVLGGGFAAHHGQRPALAAQGLEEVKTDYTKHEYYVRMRDGVRLFTVVYAPKDRSERYPILLSRTPYSVRPYGADRYRTEIGPSPLIAKEGYIFVYQDVRGRWMSEGSFDHLRPHKDVKKGPRDIDESTDTYDTIDWLIKHVPNHNDRVGMWGISYPGFYAAAGMIDAHPALKAASPQAPVADWFAADDWHHNGAFLLAHAFGWFSGAGWPFTKPTKEYPGPPFEQGLEDGYEFFLRHGTVRNLTARFFQDKIPFWNEIMTNDARNEFWKARNIRPHLKDIKPAVMTVGGWFDAENLFGALEVYRAVETQSPSTQNILVMGPWVHGGWARGEGDELGDVRFDSSTSKFYQEHIELPFFNAMLKGDGKDGLPEAYVFETGTNRWRRFDAWPPMEAVTRALYLQADGRLSFDPPAEATADAFDEYVSDPDKPVPFIPGIAPGMAQHYMVDDQRFAARRPDVLVYETEPLETDVTIAGPLIPSLHLSTSGTDADWIVKLVDVYPDRYPDGDGEVDNTMGAYQQLVRGEVIRGKFRNSFDKPQPFEPGKPTKVEFTVSDTFHTFRRGHRIMIQIQSTWFPLIDINPQKFMNIFQAREADFQKATQRVYRSKALPSLVSVGVL
ncbi:MAG: CocE/NonD family hydrolase [Luteitalea sp.]|nr:CocE/NonD family hydrolase [Luteitalea sp.]